MKSLHLLENCFANANDAKDQAALEAMSSHLIRANNELQRANDQLKMQSKKQEQCISNLMKRLESATDLVNDQQTSFDEQVHRQTETVASMLKELSKSKSEIIQLRKELAFEKSRNAGIGPDASSSSVQGKEGMKDISDEETVPTTNVDLRNKKVDAAASDKEDSAHIQYSMLAPNISSKGPLRNKTPKRIGRRQRADVEDDIIISNRRRIGSDDESDVVEPPPPFLLADSKGKAGLRSGLQEEDIDAPRPPLLRHASGLR
eukprot:scaffold25501_cov117-Cylindrotheca_fusiformis.AAC.1